MMKIFFLILFSSLQVFAISRNAVMKTAQEFAEHVWTCEEKNRVASCSSQWKPDYQVGTYIGLPYNWGGYMTIAQFDYDLARGRAAGNHSQYGILSCTTGVDCSGYVSQCWGAQRHVTSNMDEIANYIERAELLPGDALNKSGSHVVLWVGETSQGNPVYYEAAGEPVSKVWLNNKSTWSRLNGFKPIRYKEISNEKYADDEIKVSEFPFVNENDLKDYPTQTLNYHIENRSNHKLFIQIEMGVVTEVNILLCQQDDCRSIEMDSSTEILLEPGEYTLKVQAWRDASGHFFPGPYKLYLDLQ